MADSRWFADCCGRAAFRRGLATVLGEEGNELVHRLVARLRDHGAAVAADRDQSGKAEPVEMEGQRVGGETELLGHLAGGHALRAGLDQQAKDLQAIVLGKRGQSRNGFWCFHISTNMEVFADSQEAAQANSRELGTRNKAR